MDVCDENIIFAGREGCGIYNTVVLYAFALAGRVGGVKAEYFVFQTQAKAVRPQRCAIACGCGESGLFDFFTQARRRCAPSACAVWVGMVKADFLIFLRRPGGAALPAACAVWVGMVKADFFIILRRPGGAALPVLSHCGEADFFIILRRLKPCAPSAAPSRVGAGAGRSMITVGGKPLRYGTRGRCRSR